MSTPLERLQLIFQDILNDQIEQQENPEDYNLDSNGFVIVRSKENKLIFDCSPSDSGALLCMMLSFIEFHCKNNNLVLRKNNTDNGYDLDLKLYLGDDGICSVTNILETCTPTLDDDSFLRLSITCNKGLIGRLEKTTD